MIHVYLDWNVFVGMKNGSEDELLKILTTEDKFFIPYSTAHISDLMSSFSTDKQQLKYIDEDLNYLIKVTNNWCLSLIKGGLKLDMYNPKDLFQQYVDDKDYMKGFGLNTISEALNDNELGLELGDAFFNLLNTMPLTTELHKSLSSPETEKIMNVLFPNLKDNPTMGGFFNSFGKMYENFNDSEDWKILRDYSQKNLNINPNQLSNMENPMDFVYEIFKQNREGIKEFLPKPVMGPDWYNDITNEYLMLDMFGYFQDRIRVRNGKRKETFANTTQDAFHAGFASTCSFYVTNDKKTYNKTKQVFKNFGIMTDVFTPNEFVEHYHKMLNYNEVEDHYNHMMNFIDYYLDDFQKLNKQSQVYIFGTYLFDVFNTIEFIKRDNSIIIKLMNCFHSNQISLFELEPLVNKLYRIYGQDKNGFEEFSYTEVKDNLWEGRCWGNDKISIILKMDDDRLTLIFQ